eukprot:scaffold16580_cov37-Cyclotella_meneghiniana.AAC.2
MDTLNSTGIMLFDDPSFDLSIFDGDTCPDWIIFILQVAEEHHFFAIRYHKATERYMILDAANPRQFQADTATLVYLFSNGRNWLLSLMAEPFNDRTCSLYGFAYPKSGGRLRDSILKTCTTVHQLESRTAFPIQDNLHAWSGGNLPLNVRFLNVSDHSVFTVLRIEDDPTTDDDAAADA